MLAAGRYFPAAAAARRAATAKSSSTAIGGFISNSASPAGDAPRSSACIRTLSTEGTPGTVAGARAAASQGGWTETFFFMSHRGVFVLRVCLLVQRVFLCTQSGIAEAVQVVLQVHRVVLESFYLSLPPVDA